MTIRRKIIRNTFLICRHWSLASLVTPASTTTPCSTIIVVTIVGVTRIHSVENMTELSSSSAVAWSLV